MTSPSVVRCPICGYDVPISRKTINGDIVCPSYNNAQQIEQEEEFNIFCNKRKDPNNFNMEYPCDFCNRFAGQVLSLKNCFKTTPHGKHSAKICQTCLYEMQKAMSENMRNNFAIDFVDSRKNLSQPEEPEEETCKTCKYKDQIFYVCSEFLHACAHGKCQISVRPADPKTEERYEYLGCCPKYEKYILYCTNCYDIKTAPYESGDDCELCGGTYKRKRTKKTKKEEVSYEINSSIYRSQKS